MSDEYNIQQDKMKKSISVLQAELAAIRAGRANPAILDKIMVDYYGVPTKIGAMAAVSVPDPRSIVIQPWDVSTLKEIEKAIQKSELEMSPQNDGKIIRLSFPPLTEERRKDLVKQVAKKGEESKVAIRSIRREAIEKFKAMQKKSEITEDDLKDMEKDVQTMHDKFIKEIDSIVSMKEKEILEV